MWYNPIIKALLYSPLHGFMSGSILLLTFTGRKSGQQYTIPVSYMREEDTLTIFSQRKRTWWRNLQGGAPVTVRVRGKNLPATAEVIELDEETRLNQLREMYSRMMNEEQIAEIAPNLVMIRIELANREPEA
jgi:deazaflavin-dependent oxidoreductase (nitroreductase family)